MLIGEHWECLSENGTSNEKPEESGQIQDFQCRPFVGLDLLL
jgi:hypothetical protein